MILHEKVTHLNVNMAIDRYSFPCKSLRVAIEVCGRRSLWQRSFVAKRRNIATNSPLGRYVVANSHDF